MLGHLLMGVSLLLTGDIAEGKENLDRSIAMYDPAEHRPLATLFSHDNRGAGLVLASDSHCGHSAIPRQRSPTPGTRSSMPAKSVTPRR